MLEDRIRSDLCGDIVSFGVDTLLTIDFQNTQGIIFVVDSNDRERITEAREERESPTKSHAHFSPTHAE
jgi:hypothetical protein